MSGLKKYGILTSLLVFSSITTTHASSEVYANFPITLKGYSGDAKTSESYGGQMARHMLHNGLKKAASSGDLSKMEMYFNGEQIDLIHAGPAHTMGDTAVYFRDLSLIHI